MALKGPVLMRGSERAGTTWIQDVIADSARLCPGYETRRPIADPGARGLAIDTWLQAPTHLI